jgi:chemotaxis regulatin CheY-phosphate phosphatase CheZ
MEAIKLIKDEETAAFAQVETMISNLDKTTSIITDIVKYYETYSNNIDALLEEHKVLMNPVEAIGADKKKPIAPGFPGADSRNYLEYFKLLNAMLNILNKNAETIRRNIIGRLCEINNDFQEIVKAQNFLISEVSKKCEQSIQDLTEKTNNLMAKKAKAEKAFKSYENKASVKNHNEMCKECEEFRKKKILFTNSYKEAYERHRSYISTINSAMIKIQETEASRQNQLKEILFEFCPALCDDYKRLSESIKSFHSANSNWADEFVEFVESNGIVRSNSIPKTFVCHQFSFDDSRVDLAAAPEKGVTTESPLFFATVKDDYDGEMQLKKDERVYVYDGLHGKLAYVKTVDEKTGFVPSQILEIINGTYGIVVYPHIGNGEEITVAAGDIVLVSSSSESETVYENLRCDKGKLPDFCVIKEK